MALYCVSMEAHNATTAEWDHSHALEVGDVLEDTVNDERLRVESIHTDGGVTWTVIETGETETHTEESVCAGLAHSEISRESDGLSHELATF